MWQMSFMKIARFASSAASLANCVITAGVIDIFFGCPNILSQARYALLNCLNEISRRAFMYPVRALEAWITSGLFGNLLECP
jgi:hypothetical protein